MKTPFLAAIVGLVSASLVQAQVVTSGGLITSDVSVLTTGTEVNSLGVVPYFYGATFTLVNGVSFSPGTSGPVPFVTDENGITVTVDGTAGNTGLIGESGTSDATLNNLFAGDVIGSFFTIASTGLTPGHTYSLQVFDAVQGGTAGTELATDVTSAPLAFGGASSGAYSVIDTFVAPVSGDETLSITDSTGSAAYFAAYQLRDQGVVGVPEPSTYAMLSLGMAGLTFFARRKLA